jgi:hypothetical protein
MDPLLSELAARTPFCSAPIPTQHRKIVRCSSQIPQAAAKQGTMVDKRQDSAPSITIITIIIVINMWHIDTDSQTRQQVPIPHQTRIPDNSWPSTQSLASMAKPNTAGTIPGATFIVLHSKLNRRLLLIHMSLVMMVVVCSVV